jgi:beta-lactamase class D
VVEKNQKEMMSVRIYLVISATILIMLQSCTVNSERYERKDLDRYFKQYKVTGSFIIYDERHDTYLLYNKKGTETSYTPASTFKIANALIGLDKKVLKDDEAIYDWDSVIYPRVEWNKSQNLQEAFKNSTVWYFQKLAKEIGAKKMKSSMIRLKYGNMKTSKNIDDFWLTGDLRITPMQQIDFLRRLRNNKLDVSEHAMDITRKIMIANDTLGYVIRQKTGWGFQNGKNIGWLVGYIENNQNTFYFASCIESIDPNTANFNAARKNIPYQIFNELNIFHFTKKDKLPPN